MLYTLALQHIIHLPRAERPSAEFAASFTLEQRQALALKAVDLQDSIQKIEVRARRAGAYQEELYRRLFRVVTEIEERHQLHPDLFERLGPASNLYLRDSPRGAEGRSELGLLRYVTIKQAIFQGRITASEGAALIRHTEVIEEEFNRAAGARTRFHQQLWNWEMEKWNDDSALPPENAYDRSYAISSLQAMLLYSGHKVVADIRNTQQELDNLALLTVSNINELLKIRRALYENRWSDNP